MMKTSRWECNLKVSQQRIWNKRKLRDLNYCYCSVNLLGYSVFNAKVLYFHWKFSLRIMKALMCYLLACTDAKKHALLDPHHLTKSFCSLENLYDFLFISSMQLSKFNLLASYLSLLRAILISIISPFSSPPLYPPLIFCSLFLQLLLVRCWTWVETLILFSSSL